MNRSLSLIEETKSTTRRKLGVVSLLGAAFLAGSLGGAKPAVAGERNFDLFTTDLPGGGGRIRGQITWKANEKPRGTYHGTISGYYRDQDDDGYCVQGFRTGGENTYPLGPPVCPKGTDHSFYYTYKKAKKARVQVCRLAASGRKINCSPWG
ncbi:MAG: hypothetical protein ACREWE_15000 [Gammaproteobacteria bacterium]